MRSRESSGDVARRVKCRRRPDGTVLLYVKPMLKRGRWRKKILIQRLLLQNLRSWYRLNLPSTNPPPPRDAPREDPAVVLIIVTTPTPWPWTWTMATGDADSYAGATPMPPL